MKLWLISQTINCGCDTYDSAVVAAETEEAARRMSPDGVIDPDIVTVRWASLMDIHVEYLGEAREGHPAGVVCASFNAG